MKDKKPKIKKEALKLWLSGESRARICETLKISSRTFNKWRHEMDWDTYKKEYETKQNQQVTLDLLKEKERSLTLIKQLEEIFAECIKNGTILVTPRDFAQIQKVKWDILMPKTLSQYNFVKQDKMELNIELDKLIQAIKDGVPYR